MDPARRESVYGIPQFSGTGYENWKFRVEKFLNSVGLLEDLSQDVPEAAPEAVKFIEKDSKASNWIIAFVHDDLIVGEGPPEDFRRTNSAVKIGWR